MVTQYLQPDNAITKLEPASEDYSLPNAITVQAIRNFADGAKVHNVDDFTDFCASIAE